MEENPAMRCAVGFALVATSSVLAACGGDGTEVAETNAGLPASDCPEANAALKKAGLSVPKESRPVLLRYGPACPTHEEIRREIKRVRNLVGSATAPTPPAALREALESGVIHEGQDPKTYPPEVKQAIRRWEARHSEPDR
jgi:hypothetical protein